MPRFLRSIVIAPLRAVRIARLIVLYSLNGLRIGGLSRPPGSFGPTARPWGRQIQVCCRPRAKLGFFSTLTCLKRLCMNCCMNWTTDPRGFGFLSPAFWLYGILRRDFDLAPDPDSLRISQENDGNGKSNLRELAGRGTKCGRSSGARHSDGARTLRGGSGESSDCIFS